MTIFYFLFNSFLFCLFGLHFFFFLVYVIHFNALSEIKLDMNLWVLEYKSLCFSAHVFSWASAFLIGWWESGNQ